jgi:hypothetical protein
MTHVAYVGQSLAAEMICGDRTKKSLQGCRLLIAFLRAPCTVCTSHAYISEPCREGRGLEFGLPRAVSVFTRVSGVFFHGG